MKTLLSTMTALVLSASLSSVASAQTLDPSMNPAMDPNQQWQDGQGAELYQAPDPNDPSYQQYQNQAQGFGFFGPHPIAYDQGGGFCSHQGAHEHPYPVFDQNLFRMSNSYAYFVGDVADFGYNQSSYQYASEHPIGHVHGGGNCYMGWPHRHWFAPVGINFVLNAGGYMYNGPWTADYYSMRPRYVSYFNDYYRRWYSGGRYYSLRPQHVYLGVGYHRPVARPYYGRPAYGGGVVVRPPVYGGPGYRPPVYGAPGYRQPVYRAPAPVYRAPGPVYRAPGPVYRAPAPVYRAPGPVHRAPGPVHQVRGYR
jgi:hypothetical protein